uniref:Uncharacterized protein n=1 Tax=Odontella aurita TaxID=265563 RepID=A0A7S4JH81_9STRA|mmetsp:Transcript_46444/g.140666  ORF Transcript_46444/g.140666 Transcript_46444/m.140666 type:complete len:430 (+) Transcript_46444:106-1395(+)
MDRHRRGYSSSSVVAAAPRGAVVGVRHSLPTDRPTSVRDLTAPSRHPAASSVPVVPYQVDDFTHNTGRHLAGTKKHIRFSFGFAHLPSLVSSPSSSSSPCSAPSAAAAATGPACRGSEHTVELRWSGVAGKRTVTLDGRDVYFEMAPNRSVQRFEHSFPLPSAGEGGGEGTEHTLQIIGYYTVPPGTIEAERSRAVGRRKMFGTDGRFRQFDLLLDGESFHDFLRIYQLGTEECERRYGHAYEWARSHREELEGAYNGGSGRRGFGTTSNNGVGAWRRASAPPLTDEKGGGGSGRRSFDHLKPDSPNEEKKMYEAARQESLRNIRGRPAAEGADRSRSERYSAAGPRPQPTVPDFANLHAAFAMAGAGAGTGPSAGAGIATPNLSTIGEDKAGIGGGGGGGGFNNGDSLRDSLTLARSRSRGGAPPGSG